MTESRSDGRQSPSPSRAGQLWSDVENAQLVDGVRRGWSVPELALAHDRSRSAVIAQLARMAPRGSGTVPASRSAQVEWLRVRLAADPNYDWRQALRDRLRVYWSSEDDAALRVAWHEGVDLATLARRFGLSESGVHARLVAVGLSASVVETVERLGCSAGGVMEARYRRLTGQRHLLSAVLMVFGPHSGFQDGGRAVQHMSVHASRDAAAEALRELEEGRRRLNMAGRLGWVIAVRAVGEGPEPVGGPDESGIVTARSVGMRTPGAD